ncbi:MAG: bifunctional 5,10-methylene-tetrahydrofolate dehydrogenase/5,10-methylene-tetrahydrofolate cyclohydrolase [Actinobacteria bacterium 13_2_20CM_2_71_6]|nr:MAG: bifunctional 5,10-methylene-tetrahydrofolate dehydrogenase/5,10-methylene-tetrahydrofolate cyclohydrolase [Actinobacteria bacterium 13_2_20CM_2_71_6]
MLIDGKKIAADLGAELTERVAKLSTPPGLAIVVATEDESTAWYVRSLLRTAEKLGIAARRIDLPTDSDVATIRGVLTEVSAAPGVHGVICQTPLPGGLRLEDVGMAIHPAVDVDGANPVSLGLLASGSGAAFPPATAAAVLRILEHEGVSLLGKRAVVIGRSNVVGKPAALMLLAKHATVTVCHSRTPDLAAVAREADVLVAAVGRAKLVTADFVKPGAVVIDVGTNATPDGLVGDVDTASVEQVAGAVTPVPGGVGPVTTMLLMSHVVSVAERVAV